MKPSNKILIYDDNCPLCSGYTRAFVHYGFLKESGRKSFSNISTQLANTIDINKARNEIPLYDPSTKEVKYGIVSLVSILEDKIPWMGTFCRLQPVKPFLHFLYKFISYNRRVIVAPKNKPGFDCAPDFNFFYRIIFMLLFLLLNTIILYPVHHYVLRFSLFNGVTSGTFQELHLALVGINIFLAIALGKIKAIEYLGQVNMLAVIVLLLLIPLVLFNRYVCISAAINNFYLLTLGIFTCREYIRRMKYCGVWYQHELMILINGFSIGGFLFCLL